MLALSSFVVPNEQQVAAKVMDGEAILINLATGTYYSMPGDRRLHLVFDREEDVPRRHR